MKSLITIIGVLLITITSTAQTSLKGKVVDAVTQSPLAGASISIAGKGGIIAGSDGAFVIDCGKTTRITVSFVGYESYHQTIKNCEGELQIALTPVNKSLENVEITATSSQNKSILYQPSAITKLSPVELKRGNGLFLDDAINTSVPGVTMNRRAVSSGQQFNIRGYGNGSRGTRGISSNFDGQGSKVYLNGISVTDAEGITTLDDIDFGSIGNVEVVKGPAGTLYGLAIAGVVNLHTAKPEKGKTSISQDILAGNYGLQRYSTRFQTAGERSQLLLNYGHQRSDGFTIHNKSKKDFVNVVGDFQPNGRQSVTAYFGYSSSYDERSGELTVAQYTNNDFSGNIEYIKRNAHSNVYTARAGLGHTYTFNSQFANTTTVFATAFNSNVSSAGGWSDKSSLNIGLRSTFDTKFSLGNNSVLSGITGVEMQRQTAQTVGYGMQKNPLDTAATWTWGNPYYWIIGPSTSNLYATTATTSVFTEWTLTLPQDFSITAGIGYSTMNIKLDDRFFVAGKPTHYDTSYTGMVSPHVAINKVFSKQLSAYASYSRGYKAPVSSYFFIPFVAAPANTETGIINNHLKPEVGDQFEIGTKGNLVNGRFTYQLALFQASFSDKMTTVAVPLNATTTAYSYLVNGGTQNHKGVEVALKYNMVQSSKGFFTAVIPFVNFTYSDYEYKDFKYQTGNNTSNIKTFDFSGYPVVGVAKIVSAEGIDFTTRAGLYGNFVHLFRDKMPITSPDSLTTTSYNLLNAKLGYRRSLSAHFALDASFAVDNITGTKYPIMIFVNQIPDAYIAGPRKANYFGQLKLEYIF